MIRRLYIGLRVHCRYYKKHSRSGLAWSRPRADRGLSRPTCVFRTTIGACKILSTSVEIWQYEGQKPVLSKNTEWPSITVQNCSLYTYVYYWRNGKIMNGGINPSSILLMANVTALLK